MAIAGSLKELTLQGVSFNVAADANLSTQLSGFENDRIKHSGGSMKKMMGRIRTVENAVLIVKGEERDILKNFSEQTDDFMISFVTANGDNYQGLGSINLEPWESEENRISVTLHPSDDWVQFVG
jgi:hypothetical protein